MRVLKSFFCVSLLCIGAPSFAAVPSYKIVQDKSALTFVAIQNNAPIEGKFKDFSAVIHFDPEHLDQSDITAEVVTGSVTSANDDVAENLKLPEWLSSKVFPKAVFKSKKISRMPNSDNYYAEGTLTIRDKTLPSTLNFQMERMDDKTAIAKGYLTVQRNQYGVGQGQWAKDDVVKDEVRIEFRIVAEKQ